MLFYLASIIIHDIFRTNHVNPRISDTSSYLDLSPLYGSDQKEQDKMRLMSEDGKTPIDGKIKPDCFSETRLLAFPPGVGALLIMFNRFHNYVVEQIALINEGGRFDKPKSELTGDALEQAWKKYDNDLFQTGRLITCGLYVNIILVDYVRTILNLNRTDEDWQLNPRVEIPNGPEMGCGNQVSAEFNLVYRWHSAVSERDSKWTEDLFATIFNGRKPDEIEQREFLMTLGHMQADAEAKDPLERDFHNLKRDSGTKRFADQELVEILIDSIEDCANAFGPRQVPAVFKQVEILGIKQARAWNLATLNEFRKHFDLKPYQKFSDITTNKEVAKVLEGLYNHPDNVELYPGLVVEDAKEPKLPGAGLCPSFTTSRAVLSDAVALVRGDKFYTTSYHAKSLTNWGFKEQMFDTTIDNGCVMYKLFLRAFPNSFETNSVYVHYPMTVPSEMKKVLTDLGKADKYSFDRPGKIPPLQMVFSYNAAKQVTEDDETFGVTWEKAFEFLMGPPARDFMLAGNGPRNAQSRKLMESAIYLGESARNIPRGNEEWLQQVRGFYKAMTRKLLAQKSYTIGKTNEVDIIRDVGNLAHVHFCAEMFALPLKTEEFPDGVFTEYQLYLIYAAVFTCVFFDMDPEYSFPLRQNARAATKELGKLIETEVASIKATGRFSEIMEKIMHPLSSSSKSSSSGLRDYGLHMIQRLLGSGREVKDIVWGNIMGTAGGMVANQGQLLGQILDFLFSDKGKEYLPKIQELAKQDSEAADDELMHYMMEFARLHGETGLARVVNKAVTVNDGALGDKHFQPGDRVFVNFRSASRDPVVYPNPEAVDPLRPLDSYINLGNGLHQCLGLPMTRVALTAMLKEVALLPGVRAAPAWPGPKSTVKKVMKPFFDGDTLPEEWHYHAYLTEDWDSYFPFPTSKCYPLSSLFLPLLFPLANDDISGLKINYDSASGL